jgi:hypothetical protein
MKSHRKKSHVLLSGMWQHNAHSLDTLEKWLDLAGDQMFCAESQKQHVCVLDPSCVTYLVLMTF